MQLIKENKEIDLKETLAHEIHHLIFDKYVKVEKENLLGYFVQCFAGEGLAVKFTNNVSGILSKKFDTEMKENIGVDEFSFKYLNSVFENTYLEFKKTIQMIKDKKITAIDDLNDLFYSYWLNCYLDNQSKSEVPKLKQSRMYSLGNDLWGVIYDVYGMEELYKIVNNPTLFIEKFNSALYKIYKSQYKIGMC